MPGSLRRVIFLLYQIEWSLLRLFKCYLKTGSLSPELCPSRTSDRAKDFQIRAKSLLQLGNRTRNLPFSRRKIKQPQAEKMHDHVQYFKFSKFLFEVNLTEQNSK
eukprot:75820-Rhodomonas_salina.1